MLTLRMVTCDGGQGVLGGRIRGRPQGFTLMSRGAVSAMLDGMTQSAVTGGQPRRLTRSKDERIVAGVCAGIGEYLDIDPVIPRVVLAVLAVFGGVGIVLYAAAWLLVPEVDAPSTRLERWIKGHGGNRRRDVVVAVIAVLALFMVTGAHAFPWRLNRILVVITLVLAATALVARWRPSSPSAPASASARAVAETDHPPNPVGTIPATGQDATLLLEMPGTAVAAETRSWLGWLSVGAVLLVAGVLSLLALTGAAHPQVPDVLAATVAVLGAGLVVGAFFGRARGMIALGVILLTALAVADATPRNLTWSAGSRIWAPTTASASAPYVLGAGDATLDLSQLGPGPATIVGRLGAGRLVVILPAGRPVNIVARTSAGRILIVGREEDGVGVLVRRAAVGTLSLDLRVGYGDLEVRNAAS